MKKIIMTKERFEKETGFLVNVIAETVMEKGPPQAERLFKAPLNATLTPELRLWFIRHCEFMALHQYAINPTWKRTLKSEKGRDFLYGFVNHWLAGLLQNPEQYMKRCPLPIKVGDKVKLIQKPTGYTSKDSALTVGNVYEVRGLDGNNVITTTDDELEASYHRDRVSLVL